MNKVVLGKTPPEAEKPEGEVTFKEVEAEAENLGEIYVLKGVKNFKCGRFAFVDEMLVLTEPDDIDEFESMLAGAGAADQYLRRIRKVDAADDSLALMKSKLVASAVNGVETSANRPAQNLRET